MKKERLVSMSEKDKMALGLKISDNVQIKDVAIIESSFKQTPNAHIGNKSVEIDNTANVELDTDNNVIFVIADFNLKAFVKNISEPVVLIHASFLLCYDFKDEFEKYPDEAYKAFAEMNGVFNAWPYWREYVQNATVRMGLSALTIPVFRIFKAKDAGQIQKKVVKKKKRKKRVVVKKTAKKKIAKKKSVKSGISV